MAGMEWEQGEMDLSDRPFPEGGAFTEFCDRLMGNKSLRVLRLGNCGIDDDRCLELARALELNGTLQEVYLTRNTLTDKGVLALTAALEAPSSMVGSISVAKKGVDRGVLGGLQSAAERNAKKAPKAPLESPPAKVDSTVKVGEFYDKQKGDKDPHYYQNLLREQEALAEKLKQEGGK